MRRREFIIISGGTLWIRAQSLWADHHVVSGEPLIVTTELGPKPSRYTDTVDFYVRNHYAIPPSPSSPSLRIEGEVDKPQQLTPEDLNPLKPREAGAVLECAGNTASSVGLVSDGLWTGWPLGDLLALAKPKPTAAYVHLFGRDGYRRSVPLERAAHDGILATQLNGRPLPGKHGAPWRVIFPGYYGMDSVKWLERIVVAQAPLPPEGNAYLELKKDSAGGVEAQSLPRIQVKSVITSLSDGAVVRRGNIEVRGLAWSGFGSVTSVQLSSDAGANWTDASLEAHGSSYDWTLWRASVNLQQVGPVELVCRAVDAADNAQPAERDPQRLDSYAYNVYNRVSCVVVP
jgi:DMSO/TMAO reductase YedYZ molybdopterin-dependent catalytic subunit